MLSKKPALRKILQGKATQILTEKLTKTAENKSKMQYYKEGKIHWKAGQRSQYLNKLNRNLCSTIFKARTRMINVKANYKSTHEDMKCRLCELKEETQIHILEECEELNEYQKVTKHMIFKEDIKELKEVALNINKRLQRFEELKDIKVNK